MQIFLATTVDRAIHLPKASHENMKYEPSVVLLDAEEFMTQKLWSPNLFVTAWRLARRTRQQQQTFELFMTQFTKKAWVSI